jgi:hypothetical protein
MAQLNSNGSAKSKRNSFKSNASQDDGSISDSFRKFAEDIIKKSQNEVNS